MKNLYVGEVGEHLAEALLLRFFTTAKPRPDIGLDSSGLLQPPHDSTVTFYFQTKATGSRSRAISIRANTLRRWMALVDDQPVVLIQVKQESIRSQSYRFRVLHDWMIDHEDWPDRLKSRTRIAFGLSEFTEVDESGANFLEAMIFEAARIRKNPTHLWRFRSSPLVPLTEVELFEQMGHLEAFELTAAGLNEIRSSGTTRDDAWYHLHEMWSKGIGEQPGGSALAEWSNRIALMPRSPEVARERQEFRRFVAAMRSYKSDQIYKLPRFTWKQISPWRVFVIIFPEAFQLLKRVFLYPDHWTTEQRMSALLLASALATTDDHILSGRAVDLIRLWDEALNHGRAYSYDHYKLLRQFKFARAQAEGSKQVPKCLDFLNANLDSGDPWDLRLNLGYYGDRTGEIHAEAAWNKLKSPKPRDLNTRRIDEWMVVSLTELTNMN